MSAKKNVTFTDIAKFTGFSKTTISRYFNNPDSLTPANQKIISEALEKLDYKENKVAKVLANGQTEFIGIIVPDLYHHFYSEIMNRLLDTYEQYGYKFLVFVGQEEEEIERKYISELMAYQIEGLIVLSNTISSMELANLGVPVVVIEREDEYVNSVSTDNYAGGRMGAELLDQSGCDILIHIHSKDTDVKIPAYQRLDGFRDYCEEHGLAFEIVRKNLTKGHEKTKKIMQEVLGEMQEKYPEKKKGFFLSSDTYANVLMNVIIRQFQKYPSEEYAIVGFDNASISREGLVEISTVGQQMKQIAAEAMELLEGQLQAKRAGHTVTGEIVHKLVEPILYKRETT